MRSWASPRALAMCAWASWLAMRSRPRPESRRDRLLDAPRSGSSASSRSRSTAYHHSMPESGGSSRGRVSLPSWRKVLRYSVVSVINVLLGQTLLFLAFDHWLWSARSATLFATGIATIPAYLLSRRWVWGRRGRSSLTTELLPFWALSFVGLSLSVWMAGLAERLGRHLTLSRRGQTMIVMGATLGAFGVVWLVRFLILDMILFRSPPGDYVDASARA